MPFRTVRRGHATSSRSVRQIFAFVLAAAVVSHVARSLVFTQFRPVQRATVPPSARHAASATQVQEIQAVGDDSILPELLEIAAKDDRREEVMQMVDEELARLYPEDMMQLQVLMSDADSAAATIAEAVQKAVARRMDDAGGTLQALLSGTAEINEVNAEIKKMLRNSESPMPLLTVLQLNIVEAQEAGDEAKMRALMHINTLINEELEKKAPRVAGMLNKLLRMDDASIRSNILRHHLEPKEVAAAMDFDGAEDEGGKEAGQPLMAAMVRPMQLVEGITQMVDNVDTQFRVAGAEADEVRYETLEKMREVAKEARAVIGELYGDAEMENFSVELTPAFRKLMAWKATQAQDAEEVETKEGAQAEQA
mmetsp:Transcript_40174/g.92339  ORF Transcript_40174/g.92339 Transcript_40174/m.92339 type:complete len:367 (+) Transcript_40174:47-1147(+)